MTAIAFFSFEGALLSLGTLLLLAKIPERVAAFVDVAAEGNSRLVVLSF